MLPEVAMQKVCPSPHSTHDDVSDMKKAWTCPWVALPGGSWLLVSARTWLQRYIFDVAKKLADSA